MHMQKKRSIFLKVVLILFILIFGAAAYYIYFALPIGTGYTAKYLCSSIFVTGNGEVETFEEDIRPGNILFRLVSSSVDYDKKTVTSRGLGLFHEKTAVYREGLGSTLMIGGDVEWDVSGLPPAFLTVPLSPGPGAIMLIPRISLLRLTETSLKKRLILPLPNPRAADCKPGLLPLSIMAV